MKTMQKNQSVLISVIMGIYNCESTLEQAMESIFAQTCTDWELILCDDGSTDQTYAAAKRIQERFPEKVILIRNEKNMGLNITLNRCLEAASGLYIARMDGDDICSPDRFQKELDAFAADPSIAIVSTDMEYFDESGVWGAVSHPEYPETIDFLHGTPFCHAPCMVKREAYEAVRGYSVSDRLLRVEDYHLWIKMYAQGFKGRNIHEVLYQMRDDRNAYARRKMKYRCNEAYVKAEAVRMLGLPKTGYLYAVRPILVGLLPKSLYGFLHKKKLQQE